MLLKGLAWGSPREGHPEGSVGRHVADLLRTIDEWGETGDTARGPALPRPGARLAEVGGRHWRRRVGENHHAMRARRFAEGYTDDERLLAAIELHDRPYQIWKRLQRTGKPAGRRSREMLERIPDQDLFLRFVELDGSTEGKNPEPLDGYGSWSDLAVVAVRWAPAASAAIGRPSSASPYSPRVETSTTRSSRSSTALEIRCDRRGNMCS